MGRLTRYMSRADMSSLMPWYEYQTEVLDTIEDMENIGLYLGCGLGKTAIATEQLIKYNNPVNLCICQKSKIDDWIKHFEDYTNYKVVNYTTKGASIPERGIIVINYSLVWRRPELAKLKDFTLILDESSNIQHQGSKQTKFITKLKPKNAILASGTPCNGKYENLYTQLKFLGLKMNKTQYWNTFIDWELKEMGGFRFRVVNGYKNVDRLKATMRELGAVFLMTDEVAGLPPQNEQILRVPTTPAYNKFRKTNVVKIGDKEFIGDGTLSKMTQERQLCASYNEHKVTALKDWLESTSDRVIIFYNFQADYDAIKALAGTRPFSYVNGQGVDLEAYNSQQDAITAVQYQAGAHGINLQKANRMAFFSLPLSCELYTQAKGRIYRIGQTKPTFYFVFMVKASIEEKIYKTLLKGEDYTEALFEEGD